MNNNQQDEFSKSENWKLKHEISKKEIEAEKNKWENAFYDVDTKLLELKNENEQGWKWFFLIQKINENRNWSEKRL